MYEEETNQRKRRRSSHGQSACQSQGQDQTKDQIQDQARAHEGGHDSDQDLRLEAHLQQASSAQASVVDDRAEVSVTIASKSKDAALSSVSPPNGEATQADPVEALPCEGLNA